MFEAASSTVLSVILPDTNKEIQKAKEARSPTYWTSNMIFLYLWKHKKEKNATKNKSDHYKDITRINKA